MTIVGGAGLESRQVSVEARVLGEAVRTSLEQGGSFVLSITGSSMRPTLVPGRDQVCLVAPGELRPGDIVFFQRRTGDYILHRVLSCREGCCTVNGDSQEWTEQVPREAVIGVVSRIYRKGKWVEADSLPMRAYSTLWPATRRLRPALIRIKSKLQR